jgi:hypothetical protein
VLDGLAMTLVLGAGAFLVGLALALVARPEPAGRFLLGFAGSAGAHFAEMGVRALAGWAFFRHAPGMAFPRVFSGFGWILLITTALLLLLPWRWHRSFARKAVPPALERSGLLALGAAAGGMVVIWATLFGPG